MRYPLRGDYNRERTGGANVRPPSAGPANAPSASANMPSGGLVAASKAQNQMTQNAKEEQAAFQAKTVKGIETNLMNLQIEKTKVRF